MTCLAVSLLALQCHYLPCSVTNLLSDCKCCYTETLLDWQDVHVNASGAGSELQTLT